VSPRLFAGSESVGADRAPSLVAIGNFDGVHRGHQAVIAAALREAEERALRPLIVTFHPHPSEVLGRGALPALTSIERKVRLLLRAGDPLSVVVEPFTIELSRSDPEQFAQRILRERLDARVVIVGDNFRFGRGRSGDLKTLQTLGRDLGFAAHAEPLVGDDEGLFSSTRIREALRGGELARAELCLGRPHSIAGMVARGDGRGRTIAVPTANLAGVSEALPPHGVYACLVDREDEHGRGAAAGLGVMNLGVRPTLQAGFSAEVHLLDFDADLYGAKLRVHLIERLREERRFPDLNALKAQIAADISQARARLSDKTPDPAAEGAWF